LNQELLAHVSIGLEPLFMPENACFQALLALLALAGRCLHDWFDMGGESRLPLL
jgi:hypothetical protein